MMHQARVSQQAGCKFLGRCIESTVMAKIARSQKKSRVPGKLRGAARRTRETRAAYSRRLWKIPNVTPVGSTAPVSKTLPLAVKRIAETLDPDKIILFGSYAYGNPTPYSDVDLLVVMETTAKSADRSWSVSRLMIPRPFPVDILVRTPDEIEPDKQDFFMNEIVSQGKVLYERSENLLDSS